jgi:RNA polymerase sigma-70 factor (ECF subfamily)
LTEAPIFNLQHPIKLMDKDTGGIYLNADSAVVFENVFKTHFKNLHRYACSIVKDEAVAEEMVQNVFCKLWEKKELVHMNDFLAAYLYRSVYNECLNYLKHNKVKAVHLAQAGSSNPYENERDSAALKELQQKIDIALNELPEQCRTIFQLSRFEDLKYREIADRLRISVKTVENQMGKALRLLRAKLAEFLPILLLIINMQNIIS